MSEYQTNASKIAARIGTHHSTVSNWVNGDANPRPAAIRALAREFPKFTEERLFAAVGRKAPAPPNPDDRAAMLEIFDQQTKEHQ
ncbi:helix-turn-helix domain-containing protein, partial [Streptomyces albidoflavus]